MIESFKHKGLERFFREGTTRGIQSNHEKKLCRILTTLDAANDVPSDMNAPDFQLHKLKGDEKEIWSVSVNGNWRITFEFRNGNAYIVDYRDYH